MSMEGVRGLSNVEVMEMLESIAWRKTWEEWGFEMEVKPKRSMLQKSMDLEWSDYARLRQRSDRRMMIKLRGDTAAFQIETRRWRGLAREERVCKECENGEVEDIELWLLRCAASHLYGTPA